MEKAVPVFVIIYCFLFNVITIGSTTDTIVDVKATKNNGINKKASLLDSELRENLFNKHLLNSIRGQYFIFFPKQTKSGARDLSTREFKLRHTATKFHYNETEFSISFNGIHIQLRLHLNHVILSAGITIQHFLGSNQRLLSSGVENCYYQGVVKGDPSSWVSLSTCDGLRGVIATYNDTYIIHPLVRTNHLISHPHVIFRHSGGDLRKSCGNGHGLWLPYSKLHEGEYVRRLKYLKSSEANFSDDSSPKRVHLALIFDSSYQRFINQSHSHLIVNAIQTANLLDQYFSSLNIDIVLSFVEIWNREQQFPSSHSIRVTLHHFLRYKLKTLTVSPHVAQFITDELSSDTFGMSIPDSICTDRAVAVSTTRNYVNPMELVVSMAHTTAHILGMKEDIDGTCGCGKHGGVCLMTSQGGVKASSRAHFSLCSQADFKFAVQTGMASCIQPLLRDHSPRFLQLCGNNHIERGEECDCGSPEECALSDPCCDPELCILKSWATCRDGRCCHNCTLLPRSHICRAKSTECDVPEHCDGARPECPANDYVHDGYPCNNSTGYCFKGICPTADQQCNEIWGPNSRKSHISCFERFNPTGNFNGHCGRDPSSGQFLKCPSRDVLCGLLHCEGGQLSPFFGPNVAFSKTTMSFGNREYECKIVHGPTALNMPHMGMIQDGSKCADGFICHNLKCIRLVTSRVLDERCRRHTRSSICSGKGVCTQLGKCFCDWGWQGRFCSSRVNFELSLLLTSTLMTFNRKMSSTRNNSPTILPHTTYVTTTSVVLEVKMEQSGLSTTWLVIILVGVVLCLVLAFTVFMICCRRRSHWSRWKRSNSNLPSKIPSSGLMKGWPSSKKLKLFNKPGDHGFGGVKMCLSDGESDQGELPPPPIIVVSPNSAKPPQKGILKNATSAPEQYEVRKDLTRETYAMLDEFLPNSRLTCDVYSIGEYELNVDAELQKLSDCDQCSCTDSDSANDLCQGDSDPEDHEVMRSFPRTDFTEAHLNDDNRLFMFGGDFVTSLANYSVSPGSNVSHRDDRPPGLCTEDSTPEHEYLNLLNPLRVSNFNAPPSSPTPQCIANDDELNVADLQTSEYKDEFVQTDRTVGDDSPLSPDSVKSPELGSLLSELTQSNDSPSTQGCERSSGYGSDRDSHYEFPVHLSHLNPAVKFQSVVHARPDIHVQLAQRNDEML